MGATVQWPQACFGGPPIDKTSAEAAESSPKLLEHATRDVTLQQNHSPHTPNHVPI